jgi:MOSC domain-containing protein YiiM
MESGDRQTSAERPAVVHIWLKRAHGGPMDRVETAELVAGHGLRGNADQGGRRQITLIDEASWADALRDLGHSVDPSARRANVMLRGVDLRDSHGRLLRIGPCTIRIFGETRPCQLMDEARAGLREALEKNWRAGASGEVVEGGMVRVGDHAAWVG